MFQKEFGEKNIINAYLHVDEIHDYIDTATMQVRTSLAHIHCFVIPEVEGKLKGKKFSSVGRMNEVDLLVDNNGLPIIPVAKYLKYIDNGEKSFNTQKTYAYSLKLYFEYLKEINVDYRNININILSNFVGWLRNPYENNKNTLAYNIINNALNTTEEEHEQGYRGGELPARTSRCQRKTVFRT